MDINVDLYFDDAYNEDNKKTHMSRIRKRIRDSSNPLELPNTAYVHMYICSEI